MWFYVVFLPGQAQILNEFFVGGMENQIELFHEDGGCFEFTACVS